MKDIENDFVEESLDTIEKADNRLLELENNPQDISKVDEIFRIVHTIKGTSGFFDLKKLSLVANSCENILSSIRNNKLQVNTAVISTVLESLEVMRNIILYFKSNSKEPDNDYSKLIKNNEEIITSQQTTSDQRESKSIASSEIKFLDNNVFKIKGETLDNLVQTLADLVIHKNFLLDFLDSASINNYKLHERVNKLSFTIKKIQELILTMKLQPISIIWASIPRIVRNLSIDLKKKIKLDFKGEQTCLDKVLLEKIKDPMVHIIRNAMDHGIEHEEDRISKGKPSEGRISLEAYYDKGHFVIKISDDGAGMNIEKIKAKAIEKQLATKANLDRMSNKEIFQFVLNPGFSTATEVTEVSGRGVGMDVVERNIEEIQGSIEIDSEPNVGTSIILNIPLTLALVKVLIVKIGAKEYAIPEINVEEVIKVDEINNLDEFESKKFITYRDKLIPCKDLYEVFEIPRTNVGNFVVVCKVRGCCYALLVDEVCSLREIILNPVPKILSLVGIYQGCTLMADNEVVMILNINRVMNNIVSTLVSNGSKLPEDTQNVKYLLVSDSKAVPLENIEKLIEIDTKDFKTINNEKILKIKDEIYEVIDLLNSEAQIRKAIILRSQNKKLILLIDNYSKVIEDHKTTNKDNVIIYKESVVEIINLENILGKNL